MNLQDSDFALFGLPEAYALDAAELHRRWQALQRRVHPDQHAAQGAAGQRVAMQWSVRVNEAYQRLKDPLKRAAYLCERRGAPIDAERNTAMPAAFLMQQMSWREALDEADTPAAIEALLADTEAERQRLLSALAQVLDHEQDAAVAAQQVRALMFVERFIDDLENRLVEQGQ